jgi:mannose-1-phosphate guanylyltransferase
MVLCAGLGTRLRPLTDELPKPLVPVGDRSLLAHVVDALAAHGIDELVLNTHHMPEVFIKTIERLAAKAKVLIEPEILGTAGGVHGASALLGEPPWLIHNGDILCDAPIAELLDRARQGGLWLAVADREPGQGSVGLDAAGRIARLRGERFGAEVRGGDYIGVCAIGADAASELPARGCLIGDVALPRLRRGALVGAVACVGPWTDAGDLESYWNANLAWLARRGDRSWVGEGARIEAEVTRSVIGREAHVVGPGLVRACVVWPGARVQAPLAGSIVTTAGRVVRVR